MHLTDFEQVLGCDLAPGDHHFGDLKTAEHLVEFAELALTPRIDPKTRCSHIHQTILVVDGHAIRTFRRKRIHNKGLARQAQHLRVHVHIGAQRIPTRGEVARFFVKALHAQVVLCPTLVAQLAGSRLGRC